MEHITSNGFTVRSRLNKIRSGVVLEDFKISGDSFFKMHDDIYKNLFGCKLKKGKREVKKD